MDKLAILGANGFIGTQAVEFFYLQNLFEVVPIVRSYGSLARVSRFDLAGKIADAADTEALVEAFKGSRFVLHAALGDAQAMISSADAVYSAAEKAGVEKIVYLSSFAVHGLNPAAGTSEEDKLSKKQRFVYSNAKVATETKLLKRRDKGSVEIVIFRPGIVYGPRSWRWTAGLANELLAGTAYLVNNGNGICNTIYVDNLLESIRLAFGSKSADRQAFLVGDDETVTWLKYYEQMAYALKINPASIYRMSDDEVNACMKPSREDFFNHLRALPVTQSILPFVSGGLKAAIKKMVFAQDASVVSSTNTEQLVNKPRPSAEMVALQLCTYKVPHKKAEQVLGYKPLVSFDEGMRRSIAWLDFAGYPVG
ncbi:MAG: NAD(P)-dependent oxidoreductase [Candidatus Obscuribacterales bacterium]|nr:NAD(P)-dependent oxidoreductase [Candidatus Obscuribacterales bacterium]